MWPEWLPNILRVATAIDDARRYRAFHQTRAAFPRGDEGTIRELFTEVWLHYESITIQQTDQLPSQIKERLMRKATEAMNEYDERRRIVVVAVNEITKQRSHE